MPGSKYPDEVRAQVVAGARAGLPSPRIAAETNVPARTVREWITHAKEQAQLENRDPLLMNREYRLAFMAQAINEHQLEEIADLADQGKPTTNLVIPVNALRGTSIDKIMKDRDIRVRNRSNEAAHSLADAINRLATLDTSHLAGLIEAEYEVKDA